MKKLAQIFLILILSTGIKGQQKPLTSLFMTNPFAINPALAGTYDYFQIISNNRFQWVGFKDAPITNTLSIFGPLVKYPMGWGGTITYDVAGSISIGSIHGSYAYYYPINESLKVSMGLNLGFMQYKIDLAKITVEDINDPQYNTAQDTYYPLDATVGVYCYSSTYNFGFVATHLINNKIKFGEEPTGLSKLKSHFYLIGGYKHLFTREWSAETALILKKVSPAPFQLDFNVRGWYRNMIWMGVSYRTQEALSILLGYVHDKKINVSYSYDIVFGPLGPYNFGSHEFTLGYRFDSIKK